MSHPIGTLLKVACPGKGVDHYGILSNGGLVINNGPKNGVSLRTWKEFSEGEQVYAIQPSHDDLPAEVVHARALSQIGKQGYSLFFGNCEHFTSWCTKDKWKSKQLLYVGVIALLILVLAALIIVTLIQLLKKKSNSNA